MGKIAMFDSVKTVNKSAGISLILLTVLALNVISSTVLLSVALCSVFVLLNTQTIAYLTKRHFAFLSQLAAPLAMMLLIGLIVGLTKHNVIYDVFKDAYFFLKVIIYIFFAYVLFKKNNAAKLINTFAWFGIGASVLYAVLLISFISDGAIDVSSVDRYRKTIPDLPYDPLLSIITLLFVMPRMGLLGRYPVLFSTLQSVVIASTLSRMSLLILFAIFAMYVRIKLRISKGIFMLLLMFGVVSVVGIVPQADPGNRESGIVGELAFKVFNIFNETLSSSFDDRQAIIENWRAYEAAQGIAKYTQGTTTEKLIGYGFGALTDIGLEVKLGEDVRSDVPIFHNGYIYLLVKLGLVGVFLYLLFVYRVYSFMEKSRNMLKKSKDDKNPVSEEIAISILVFFLVAITSVFFGIFNNAIFNNLIILLIILLLNYMTRAINIVHCSDKYQPTNRPL